MSAGERGWTSGLFDDREIAHQFSDSALFADFARFEQALVRGLAMAGLIDAAHAAELAAAIAGFEPDRHAIADAAIRDGVPVPEYVRQLRARLSGPGRSMLHHGATSQDLVDTAHAGALVRVGVILDGRLGRLLELLAGHADRDGGNGLQAITRMQPAVRFKASDRIAAWRRPLEELRDRLPELQDRARVLQFGGAAGDLGILGDEAATVAGSMARDLGLHWPGHSWHAARGPVAAYAGWLSELTGALGKIGQDVALMALRGDQDIRLAGGGSSSAMPHKHNPVSAERLVTLARYNATLVSGMHHAQIHEMERSGAAWMLEWMIIPQMCETAGASLVAACALARSIERIGEPE